jgi:putative isomerase
MRWSVLISFSADGAGQATQQAEQARRELGSLVAAAAVRWNRFAEQLPVPDDAGDERSVKTLRLAAWALENSLYAPRGKMERWGSVPAKVYFPFFWGWDTPQHVLGLSEWNPKMAGDVLLTQLQGNRSAAPALFNFKLKIKGITIFSSAQRNQIPSKINDSLQGVLNLYAQPPLQSWAALRTYQRFQSSDEKEGFLKEVLPPLRENIRWWEENRRLKNGFFSYINGLESGLDDSPRFYPRSFLPSFMVGLIPRFLSAVDLNCWLFQSYTNLSYLSREAGRGTDAEQYLRRADALKEIIDEKLWSADDGAWLDCRNGRFIKVITPVIWWPAFLGASANLEKIRTVIERYILNPHKFWGKHGIPSVSFDDVTYNVRKDGYYWRGQIWMINNYAALEVLFRFGYAKEAALLHDRVMQTLHRSAGLYETYNADTGAVGWSSRGPGILP